LVISMVSALDEFLDQTLQEDFKNLENTHRNMMNAVKRVKAAVAAGNLDALKQALVRYGELVDRQKEVLQGFQEKLPSFDLPSFLGENFHQSFLAALDEQDLAVEEAYPVYEVLPFKIRVQPDKEMVTINEKTVRDLRPGVLARRLKREIERLQAASFDAGRFLAVLAAAYDLEMAKNFAEKKIEANEQEVLLRDIYKILTPLPQQKRAYPLQLFAFDLHRVQRSGQKTAPDGRRLVLGSVRDPRRALVILDARGQPERLGTLKFYREG